MSEWWNNRGYLDNLAEYLFLHYDWQIRDYEVQIFHDLKYLIIITLFLY